MVSLEVLGGVLVIGLDEKDAGDEVAQAGGGQGAHKAIHRSEIGHDDGHCNLDDIHHNSRADVDPLVHGLVGKGLELLRGHQAQLLGKMGVVSVSELLVDGYAVLKHLGFRGSEGLVLDINQVKIRYFVLLGLVELLEVHLAIEEQVFLFLLLIHNILIFPFHLVDQGETLTDFV